MKFRVAAICLVLMLALPVIGCGRPSQQDNVPNGATTTKIIYYDKLGITCPRSWSSDITDKGKLIKSDSGVVLLVNRSTDPASQYHSCDEIYQSCVDAMEADELMDFTSRPESVSHGEAVGYRSTIEYTHDGKPHRGWFELVVSGDDVYTMVISTSIESFGTLSDMMLSTIQNAFVVDAKAPDFEQEQQGAAETISQRNAVITARNYISTMGFSYSGLIDQLEFDQFSHEDAVYGADNCGADWNEQAARRASEYMQTMPFSRGGLIDQLKFEGFTDEQATYGADSVGL